jgi:hypothetical protein
VITVMSAVHPAGLSLWDLLVIFWIISGVCAAVGAGCRFLFGFCQDALALRHQRRIEVIRAGWQPPCEGPAPAGPQVMMRLDAVSGLLAETVLPAAVIPAPPGARPVTRAPGRCRHERIVPVISGDGELHRWICANYPRCAAKFPADVAVYED